MWAPKFMNAVHYLCIDDTKDREVALLRMHPFCVACVDMGTGKQWRGWSGPDALILWCGIFVVLQ
jgi:hypothetical protein